MTIMETIMESYKNIFCMTCSRKVYINGLKISVHIYPPSEFLLHRQKKLFQFEYNYIIYIMLF